MKKFCFYPMVLALMVLSACAQKRPVYMPQSHLPPESVPEIGGAVPGQATVPDDSAVGNKGPDVNPMLSAVRPVQRPRPAALTRMIKNAENQLKNKQPQRAFSILEQALYIDGQDPLVWHLMARAQLDQGNVVQAISLAKKSNSLAAAYPDVKEKNAALLRSAQGAN
nr:tetratricopeptide repeat protein [uncultured Desulfobacter sp.]